MDDERHENRVGKSLQGVFLRRCGKETVFFFDELTKWRWDGKAVEQSICKWMTGNKCTFTYTERKTEKCSYNHADSRG